MDASTAVALSVCVWICPCSATPLQPSLLIHPLAPAPADPKRASAPPRSVRTAAVGVVPPRRRLERRNDVGKRVRPERCHIEHDR